MAAFQCSKNDWNSENIGKYIDLFEYTLKITKTCKYFSTHNYEIIITPIIWIVQFISHCDRASSKTLHITIFVNY